MTTVFQLLDDDETTVLFDFMDATGTINPHGLKSRLRVDPNFSAPAGEHSLFQPPDQPGGSLAFTRDELVESDWRLVVQADTIQNLNRGVGEMARRLRGGKVLKWQPDGATEERFIDYVSVSIGALARGQDASTIFLRSVDAEFPITVVRKPFMRGPKLDSDTNKAKNSLFLHEGATAGRPRDWAWLTESNITNQSIDAATEAYKFDIATALTRILEQSTAAASAAAGDIWTFYFYGFANAGTDVRARARIQYLDSANVVLASHLGTLTTLGIVRPNMSLVGDAISVTTPAAPTGTNRMRIAVQFENETATQRTVRLIGAQLEKASAATKLVVATETQTNEVTETADGYPSVAPVFIHGDAPAPVSFRLRANGTSTSAPLVALRSRPIVGDKRLSDYLKTSHFAQCESAVQGTDTGLITTETELDFSPASGNVGSSTTFATNASMADRLTFTLSTLLESRRGTWDVYLRGRKSVSGSPVRLEVKWGLSSEQSLTEPEIAWPDTTTIKFLKLARIQVPEHGDFLNVRIVLRAARDSGTTAFRWDYIVFVPVDEAASRPGAEAVLGDKHIHTDPERSEVFTTDANHNRKRGGTISGPVPFFVPPGLAVVIRHMMNAADTSAAITINETLQHIYSPRFYQ